MCSLSGKNFPRNFQKHFENAKKVLVQAIKFNLLAIIFII